MALRRTSTSVLLSARASSKRTSLRIEGKISRSTALSYFRQFSAIPASELLCPPFTTLCELMTGARERFSTNEAIGVKKDGVYNYLTYSEVAEQVDHCRGALAQLGVKKGDTVAIISRNRLEWILTAYGSSGLGAVYVPMYEQQKESDWRFIIKDSGASVLVVSTVEIYEKVKEFAPGFGVKHILCCDLPEDHPNSFKAAMANGKANPVGMSEVVPSDLATLTYTSGTTGTPKGVMLSHSNLCSNIKACFDHVPEGGQPLVNSQDRSLAFLPWAHCYGQTCELHSGIAVGASAGIAAGAPGDAVELLANIQEVKPTVLFSVPTLYKKVYDGVHKKIEEETSPIKKFLMKRAIEVGLRVNEITTAGGTVGPFLGFQHRTLDKIVLSKMRAPLGGRLRVAVVAGAPTPVPVLLFLEALGVKVTEGYGLTETTPVVSITYPDPRDRVIGTVGCPVPNTEIRLVLDGEDVGPGEEGELWVAGPQVMQGYWNNPEATAEVIVEENGKRWFRTGDLVTLVQGKFIKVTGRSKDQYKLENGKYVAPGPIEQVMSLSKFVNQCVLYGNGQPHNVALIVPDFEAVAAELGLEDWFNTKKLCKDPKVIELLKKDMERLMNEHDIKKYEQPKDLLLISEAFSADNEMLTPKLSIRKPNVIKAYKEKLDALYTTYAK